MTTPREDVPAHVFLDPRQRRYPVKTKRDGQWQYDRKAVHSAINRANAEGNVGLQRRASAILRREFEGSTSG